METSLLTLSAQIKDVSGDVIAAELDRAARSSDEAQVQRWGMLCASHGRIDERQAKRRTDHMLFCVSGAPVLLAAYYGDVEMLQLLVTARPECIGSTCAWCVEGGCAGGRTALHTAVSRQSPSCVARLLALGADASLPMCWRLEWDEGEPEWDEAAQRWTGGCFGWTALRLAAARGHDAACRVLLAHGASPHDLVVQTASSAWGGDPTRAVLDADGQPVECCVCLEGVLAAAGGRWECGHTLHLQCAGRLKKVCSAAGEQTAECPLCRAPLETGPQGLMEASARLASVLEA